MRILHYFLGFPPYRSGGMTIFCLDLMKGQRKSGNEVFALWPGRMNGGNISVREAGTFDGIASYELINPLPVPLDEGIRKIAAFVAACDGTAFRMFLTKIRPDVIHVHTLMGLHREFLTEAGRQGVACVYTAHDFFGICPKVILYRNGNVCTDDRGCTACVDCNRTALTLPRIALLQSPAYRMLKDSALFRSLRSQHRSRFFDTEREENIIRSGCSPQGKAEDYQVLRAYYRDMLEKMSAFHFASASARDVFEQYLPVPEGRVVGITHMGIRDRRDKWTAGTGPIRYAFLSGAKPRKGYDRMLSVMDELWEEGKRDFELRVFGDSPDTRPYMTVFRSGYRAEELPDVLRWADAVLAPGQCYETFGFAVPEAISCGVPVIVSDRVGAKEMIGAGGVVFPADDAESLRKILGGMNREILEELHRGTLKVELKQWQDMTGQILDLYREVCS